MSTRFLKSRPTLGVRDVAASIDFYIRAVGLGVIVTMGDPVNFALLGSGEGGSESEGDSESVGGSGSEVLLGLFGVEHPTIADFACCYIDVEGVEALHRRCAEAGATIIAPLTRQPWGNYDFVIADPDGHQVAFGEVPHMG